MVRRFCPFHYVPAACTASESCEPVGDLRERGPRYGLGIGSADRAKRKGAHHTPRMLKLRATRACSEGTCDGSTRCSSQPGKIRIRSAAGLTPNVPPNGKSMSSSNSVHDSRHSSQPRPSSAPVLQASVSAAPADPSLLAARAVSLGISIETAGAG